MILTKTGTGYPSMLDRFKLPDHAVVSLHLGSGKKAKGHLPVLEFKYDPLKQPDYNASCKPTPTLPKPEQEQHVSSIDWHYWINHPQLKWFPHKTAFLDTIRSDVKNANTNVEVAVHPLTITLLKSCPDKFLTVKFPQPKQQQKAKQIVEPRPDKEYNIQDAKDIVTDIIAGFIPLSWATDPSFIIGKNELNYYYKAHVVAYFNEQLIHLAPNEAWMKARIDTCKSLDQRELSKANALRLEKFISEAKRVDDFPVVSVIQQKVKNICGNVIEEQIKASTGNASSVNKSNKPKPESSETVDYKVEIKGLASDGKQNFFDLELYEIRTEKVIEVEKMCVRLPMDSRRSAKIEPKHEETLHAVMESLRNYQKNLWKKCRKIERQANAKTMKKMKAERQAKKDSGHNDEVSERFVAQFNTAQIQSAFATYEQALNGFDPQLGSSQNHH